MASQLSASRVEAALYGKPRGRSLCSRECCTRLPYFYKAVWTPSVGEILPVSREPDNGHNTYAVCVKRGGEIVGHVPRQFLRIVWYFLCRVFSRLA